MLFFTRIVKHKHSIIQSKIDYVKDIVLFITFCAIHQVVPNIKYKIQCTSLVS
jgi:hypothetical protein